MSSSGNESPMHAFIEQNHYYHSPTSPVFNPYACSDSTSSDNSDSVFFRQLRSPTSDTADPIDDNQRYRMMIENQIRSSISSGSGSFGSRGSARSPFSPIENRESPTLGSPSVFTGPVNMEEDVLVMDGILVPSVPGSRRRCLSSSDSGCSSSSGSNSSYKKGLCRSSKGQFAYGKENQRPKRLPNKSKPEAQICKTYTGAGSCSYGSKCRFLHQESSTTALPSAILTTKTISPIKLENPTSSCVIISNTDLPLQDLSTAASPSATLTTTRTISPINLENPTNSSMIIPNLDELLQDLSIAASPSATLTTTPMISAITAEHPPSSRTTITANTDWCPPDDGIEATSPTSFDTDKALSSEDNDAYIDTVLYGPTRKRLPVFIDICPK